MKIISSVLRSQLYRFSFIILYSKAINRVSLLRVKKKRCRLLKKAISHKANGQKYM